MKNYLLDDECVEDLQLGGLSLIQKKSGFRFGVDCVILADFCKAKKTDTVFDFGTGTGIMPILTAHNFDPLFIKGFEILPHYADMASRSVERNNLSQKISIVCGDYRDPCLIAASSATLVISNPPYQKVESCLHSPDSDKALARSEFNATLEDTVKAAARALAPGGRFCMVHRPERLTDAICLFRQYGLEPKKLRLVLPKLDKAPALFLIEGLRGGNSGLRCLPPLILHEQDGRETEELTKIYRRGQY